MGSLAVDYQIYGTEKLANVTLNDVIKDSFEKEPDMQISTGTEAFSGKINPESQQLSCMYKTMKVLVFFKFYF